MIDIDTGLKWLSLFVGSGILIYLITLAFTSGKYCKTIDHIETSQKDISKKLDALINSFNCLVTELRSKKLIENVCTLFASASPKALTDKGREVLDNSGLKKFVEDNVDELKKRILDKNLKTSYDIDVESERLLLSFSEDSRLNPVKEYAFKTGLDLTLMLMAAGIYLRDIILKEKKG